MLSTLKRKLEVIRALIAFSFKMAWRLITPLNILLVAVFAVLRNWDPLRQVLDSSIDSTITAKTAMVITASFVISQIFRFVRGLRRDSTFTDCFPLKPMFFPCRTAHQRMFPKTHSFAYSYLLVGIPVRWKGSVGGMLSVDQTYITSCSSKWLSLDPWKPWYSVSGDDYHVRGHVDGGLDEKLRDYLTSQGVDHKKYADAYLLTAAKFLGYSFNPISIWYLYSSTKELQALVLEVNNTFNERHSYFLEPIPNVFRDQPARYGSTWDKDFFVSPFNSRDGAYSISTNDPFYPNMTGTGKINMTITLSTQLKPMLVARLDSTTLPLDPVSMTVFEKMKFLAAWWWVGLATFFPRTIKEAFNLQFRRGLKFLSRPEPRIDTMSRHADETERCIEGHFRRYLREVISNSNEAITVRYTSAGLNGVDAKEEVMLSSSAQLGLSIKEADIKVLTPLFYSRIVQYPDFWSGVFAESANATISISDPNSASKKASSLYLHAQEPLKSSVARLKQDRHVIRTWWDDLVFPVLVRCKRPPKPIPNLDISDSDDVDAEKSLSLTPNSDLDAFILENGTYSEKREYAWSVFKLLFANKIAFGWMEILYLEIFGLRILVAWMLVKGVDFIIGALKL